eukprot:CAMPEP_0117688684 /NCGR_PEP_ID=MMETSP0804-20121206/23990_1 /TAXON_ID=1074897 /ORGANISM="Tetraselmis astigmatica, Strain CCMP880" /LENGTH=47 /DNA_ID= /DNA_START= /DNA_END= /DNA_ORIENTATION=
MSEDCGTWKVFCRLWCHAEEGGAGSTWWPSLREGSRAARDYGTARGR